MRRNAPSAKGARQAVEGQKASCGDQSREGGGSGGCYVTAACLTARDLTDPDVCYEARLHALLLDEYVAKLPGGDGLVADHRLRAARATRTIGDIEDARAAYLEIFERWVSVCVPLLLCGSWDEAYLRYQELCRDVEGAFLTGR